MCDYLNRFPGLWRFLLSDPAGLMEDQLAALSGKRGEEEKTGEAAPDSYKF
jgi:hypothetical protein